MTFFTLSFLDSLWDGHCSLPPAPLKGAQPFRPITHPLLPFRSFPLLMIPFIHDTPVHIYIYKNLKLFSRFFFWVWLILFNIFFPLYLLSCKFHDFSLQINRFYRSMKFYYVCTPDFSYPSIGSHVGWFSILAPVKTMALGVMNR